MIRKAVLAALLSREGWSRYGPLFSREYFSSESGRDLFEVISSFWESAGDRIRVLDDDTLEALLKVQCEEDSSAVAARMRYLREAESIPQGKLRPLIEAALTQFSEQQLFMELANDLSSGEFDSAEAAMRFDALARARLRSYRGATHPHEDVQVAIKAEKATQVYPTGISEMDKRLHGGLWDTELGVAIGPSNRGKTWFLVHMGAQALQAGIPIQHHTFEISERRTKIRYFQSLTHQSRPKVMRSLKAVASELQEMDLPLWSVRDHSGADTTTALVRQEISRFIEECRRAGYDKAPLLIVDYMDKVRPARAGQTGRFAIQAMVEELRQIASSYGVGLWTATQTRRDTYDSYKIEMQDVAEAITKVWEADLILSLQANDTEDEIGVMRWGIAKTRERGEDAAGQVAVRAHKGEQFFDEEFGDIDEVYGYDD